MDLGALLEIADGKATNEAANNTSVRSKSSSLHRFALQARQRVYARPVATNEPKEPKG